MKDGHRIPYRGCMMARTKVLYRIYISFWSTNNVDRSSCEPPNWGGFKKLGVIVWGPHILSESPLDP